MKINSLLLIFALIVSIALGYLLRAWTKDKEIPIIEPIINQYSNQKIDTNFYLLQKKIDSILVMQANSNSFLEKRQDEVETKYNAISNSKLDDNDELLMSIVELTNG